MGICHSEEPSLNVSLRGARQCDEATFWLRRLLRPYGARNDIKRERLTQKLVHLILQQVGLPRPTDDHQFLLCRVGVTPPLRFMVML
jgi:hypothetical protein